MIVRKNLFFIKITWILNIQTESINPNIPKDIILLILSLILLYWTKFDLRNSENCGRQRFRRFFTWFTLISTQTEILKRHIIGLSVSFTRQAYISNFEKRLPKKSPVSDYFDICAEKSLLMCAQKLGKHQSGDRSGIIHF